MMMKRYYYKDVDGSHFPDASLGDDLYYSISYDCWIKNENDEVTSVTWVLPPEVESSDDYTEYNIAHVKLKALHVGTHLVTCILETVEEGKTQTRTVPMRLKVY